jgi:nicotinate-nucleotide pyrophosphorylase (carboxylating)
MMWDTLETRELIARALDEDMGAGDLTSLACVPAESQARGRFIAKRPLVVAGIELLPLVYEMRQMNAVSMQLRVVSGERAATGTVLAEVEGPTRLLLECERVALNFVQHLSGVATLTRRFVDAIEGTRACIRDTRKTIPGLRRLEKLAVISGGGTNQRMGLYDALLIKENHIAAAGGIRKALEQALKRHPDGVEIQIEVRNLDELNEALEAGARSILLDNFSVDGAARATAMVRGRAIVEISGGVTLETVRAYAEAGPERISVGALTHSAPAADISFLIE